MRQYKLKKCKRVHGVYFSPDGARLLAVGGAEVRMVDSAVWLALATGENAGRIDQFANCYAVDPGLTRYALCGATRGRGWGGISPLQWTPLAGAPEWQAAPSPRGTLSGAAFDPTGTQLALSVQRTLPRRAGETGQRFVFELALVPLVPGEEVVRFAAQDAGQVLAFSADGSRLAITGGMDWEPAAEVYDLAARRRVLRFEPPGTVSRAVLFLPDDRLVVANARNVYVLPPEGGEPLFTLAGHPKQVNAVALTPDGRRLLTASHDGSIRTWDASTGEPGPAFEWGIGPVTAVAFAPDGLTCAAAGLNGKVVVWDVDQ
jgi:WD40 repeat protein